MYRNLLTLLTVLSLLSAPTIVKAKILSSSANHYRLQHSASSTLEPNELWARLINPAQWWHPDHTYSGDAANLSLSAKAGGLWSEDWNGNSVYHGSVLLVKEGEMLRLNAPFGPLQEMAVNVVWTISLIKTDTGTTVVFDEVANGSSASKLNELAPAVDFVKSEAIHRLTQGDPRNAQ